MFRRAFITTMLIVAVAFMVSACGQDDGSSAPKVETKSSYSNGGSDTKAELPAGHPPMPSDNEAYKFRDALTAGNQGGGGGMDVSKIRSGVSAGGSMSAKGKDVRLSDALKAKWSTVEIEVTEAGKKKEILITVGKKTKVGKTYSILVDAFIPEYTMFEDHIGTRGDEPKNPAIRVELFEGDKSIAKGWVFKRLADFNSYQNEKVGVVLLTPKGTK
ncbi:hypothetical protein MNBD_DELTA01-250 [hydrothermal vent metagenome]|uniref:Uncharacterized protein n=1 Tax=hydrothermal vent metagenome TaxID=652676 RepID=A0A3B0QMC1_9ZZZZ